MSTISVIIPAYNAEKTILKCLMALRQQTHPPLEIIIVDDGSTDQTAELSRAHADVITTNRRNGPSEARNTGASAAQGDILAFTDSDCIVPKNWLEKIAAAFSDETVGAVGGGYSSGMDNTGFWQIFCHEELLFRRRKRMRENITEVQTLVSNNFACRKHLFMELKGFPKKYSVAEDMLLSYGISRKSRVLWLNDNGVRHQFKNSFKNYLKQQYSFGAGTTRFFLQNPEFFTVDTHQGKRLHFAITLMFGSACSALISLLSFLRGDFFFGCIFFSVLFLGLFLHFALYFNFIRYLSKIGFHHRIKVYFVSLSRDFVCGISFIDGIIRAFRK